MNSKYRTEIHGWRHTPNNPVKIAGKALTFNNWRIIEVDGDSHIVCDVFVGDPSEAGGTTYDEIHVYHTTGGRRDWAGLKIEGVGHDDPSKKVGRYNS